MRRQPDYSVIVILGVFLETTDNGLKIEHFHPVLKAFRLERLERFFVGKGACFGSL